MRPHTMTKDRGLQPDLACQLYVGRDDTTSGGGRWRLLWAVPGSDAYVHAEGECSARYHRTKADAIADGERRYGERAKWWRGHGHGFH